jgi:hypothetical protein
LLIAPSKANKKAIEAVADQITGCFEMVYAKRFHDFSFLSNDMPFERKLRACCEERYSGGELLMKIEEGGLDRRILVIPLEERLQSRTFDLVAWAKTMFKFIHRSIRDKVGPNFVPIITTSVLRFL